MKSTRDAENVIPIDPEARRLAELVTVYWYDHSCEWLTKYCDEHHRRSARIPRVVLEAVATVQNA